MTLNVPSGNRVRGVAWRTLGSQSFVVDTDITGDHYEAF